MRRIIPSAFHALLDFLYPPLCISCARLLTDSSRSVCPECLSSIGRVHADDDLFRQTRDKLRADGCVDDLVSLFVFEKGGPFQHIAHAVKYQSFESLARMLGRQLGEFIMKDAGIAADVLVPVPLHRIKFRERGYNQAELVARGIADVTGMPLAANALVRKRHTKTQTKLSYDERRKNMAEAFAARESAGLAGKSCILVDDVITTGATTTACAAALRQAGVVRIIAASTALAQKDAA